MGSLVYEMTGSHYNFAVRLATPFFFTQVPFFYFLKKMQKMKIDYAHCTMRTMWESLRYPEKAALSALVCPGWNLGEVMFACSTLSHGVPEGKNESFLAIKMKIHQFFFRPWPPRGLKKTQREAGDFARLLCAYMWYICHCYCIAGHSLKSLGALMYLKPKTLNTVGCQNSSVWVMFWILFPCRDLQHWSHSTAFFLPSENCGMWSTVSFYSMSSVTKKKLGNGW